MQDVSTPYRARFTPGQGWLLALFITFGAVLTPLAFIVMLLTVQKLMAPSFGFWAWTVPVGTEAGFVGVFCLDLLLEWKHRPLKVLRAAPWLLAAASLALNVWASNGSAPAAIGHAVLPLLFFGYILAAESAVRRLSVTDEDRAVEVAMADALAHARDLVRDRLGRFWSFRCPSLLRRQLRSGRATATVREAAATAARYGRHAELEAAVGQWVADALAVAVKAAVNAETARQGIARSMPASEPETMPEAAPETSPRPRSGARTKLRPEASSEIPLKLPASKSRSMSPSALEPHVSAMLREYGTVSEARVKQDLHVGTAKAREALRLAKGNRTVVQMSAR